MSIVIQNILLATYWKVSQVDTSSIARKILPFFGIVLLSNIIYKIGSDLFLFLLHESTLPKFLSRSGDSSWAFITGASDGIGRGLSEELLSRGFNVILHGRNATKLEGVKSELQVQFPNREIRLAVLDVAAHARDHAAISHLVSELKADGITVSVLVNNVGGMASLAPAWLPLHLRDAKQIDMVIDLNAMFTTQLTRAMLPSLFEAKPALIINIGSLVGQLPSPYLTLYAGAKAYLGAWSRSLSSEMLCEKRDVEVMHINVGQVRAQHDKEEPTLFAPSSRRMGKAILDMVGSGRSEVAAYWPHALQMWLITSMPESLINVVMIRLALQKKEEEKAKGIKTE
jgi:17beta-estradiol 17-dehydrogenase / very-long-chain 3-oxoacyl-CoA reductase